MLYLVLETVKTKKPTCILRVFGCFVGKRIGMVYRLLYTLTLQLYNHYINLIIGIMFRIFVKLTAYMLALIAFGFLISASIEKYDYNVKTVYFYRLHHFEFDITLQNGLKYVF